MNNKKTITVSATIAVLLIATLTATYAYFQSKIGNSSSTPTTVTAKSIDGLTFNAGQALTITANQTNFANGSGNLSTSTSPSVILKARNDASASYNYRACLNITENTFVHSAVTSTATSTATNLTSNLIVYPYATGTSVINGVQFTVNDDQSITISGTATSDAHFVLANNLTLSAGNYFSNTVGMIGDENTMGIYFGSNKIVSKGSAEYFNTTSAITVSPYVYVKSGKTVNTIIHPYLSKTPIVGKNIIEFPYIHQNVDIYGIKYTNNQDGTITAKGTVTNTNGTFFSLNQNISLTLPAGYYYTTGIGDFYLTTKTSDSKYIQFGNPNKSVHQLTEDTTIVYIYLALGYNKSTDSTVYPKLYYLGDSLWEPYGYYNSPELELTVTKNGTTVLTKDITSEDGIVCVPTTNGGTNNTHSITATAGSTTTDTWKATITFKNYGVNQNANSDKNLNANFIFTKL